ncbi:hypothetical protein [Saccharibacillus sp. JS10]|uniref:hypothetical protein n=1 Tax=Saccharibacillus sp. JS10 TaxID=2950552 RepID=UPI0021096444|nr:hypothetical protein [Saccharibacillus sp. JS10]MCQ4085829.1 hypothetical protein [Saccharibacillus sp. JS10]
MMHRIFQIGYGLFFAIALLMLLVLPWPNGTAMYPFMILVICAWGFWYSGKKGRRGAGPATPNVPNRTPVKRNSAPPSKNAQRKKKR